MICRLILPVWVKEDLAKIREGDFALEQIYSYNKIGYNAYYLPNTPSQYDGKTSITGAHIDTFEWVFVDMDSKDGVYKSKEDFLETVGESGIYPTKVIDSGNGVHVYWKVQNLDAMSYLRFQRRLMRVFNTDEAVGQLFQLMRIPGTLNTKREDVQPKCELLIDDGPTYTAEELDKLLPPILTSDEQYCQQHYAKTHNSGNVSEINDTLPPKFGKLLRENHEVKDLWSTTSDDRSKADYRLGHLMFANNFTKEEATSVLVNSAKAIQRAPIHRVSYAQNIVDKIWTFELTEDKDKLDLSLSVKDILQRSGDTLKGTAFRCHPRIDNTQHGFRLGQVIGLVAGSGVGKTAFALNMFRWFAQQNPDYHHFFVPLEQPANEIADRWKTMCGEDTSLHEKVHIISNYDERGGFRHLSFDDIKTYILKFQVKTSFKLGCIVIDHIGALKKKGKTGENQDLMDICHAMKAFSVQTNTLLVMQSQTNREKAGIGDLELNKDAAFGTMYFEAYCDYLITLWQPLKRCHGEEACPTVTAFKFCKIRHKKKQDVVKEDAPYYLYFDSDNEQLRDLTQDEETSFRYFLPRATNKRKADRKTDLVEYSSVPYKESHAAETNGDKVTTRH